MKNSLQKRKVLMHITLLNKIKVVVARRFSTLYFFYTYLGVRLVALLAMNLFMAVLDSVGLIMFVPLLEIADDGVYAGNNPVLKAVFGLFQSLNVPASVYSMLILIVFIFGLKAVVNYYGLYYQTKTLQYFAKRIRKSLIAGLSDLSYKEFAKADAGKIQNSLTVEAQQVAIASQQYIETIKYGLIAAVYILFAFAVDWQFSSLILIGGGLTSVIYKRFYTRTRELSRYITRNNHDFGGALIENVNHFKYLKASGRNVDFANRLDHQLSDWIRNNIKIGQLDAQINALREPLLVLIIAIIIAVKAGVLGATISSIMVVLLLFYRAMSYVLQLQGILNSFLAKSGSLENIVDFTSYLKKNSDAPNGTFKIQQIKTIDLRHISLSLGNRQVLKDINLKINAHQTVAFVGESGSGKSTLVNVICSVLRADTGLYMVNDKPLTDLDQLHFKSKIGYIAQEPTIFNADIYDNVTFWAPRTDKNIERFKSAIERCHLTRFLDEIPDGMNALLGHNGMTISGGQKQRISIARELYKGVELLIMDEATSALDSETENEIKKSLEDLHGDITIVSVAHRLSTIQNADTIYLMDAGRIAASGDFATLRRKSEYFQHLAELQGL